jgi:PilZ domain
MESSVRRAEERTPKQVAVDLTGLDVRVKAQQGVTENVSARGARVVTSGPWKPNDRIVVRSLQGRLQSRGRVVYCQPLKTGFFAIGLALSASVGEWTLQGTKPGNPA